MVQTHRLRVACITCYFDPDYVRSRTLRAGLAQNPDVELIIIKNRSKGIWKYAEVLAQMLRVRWRDEPDVWLLNFRGYELLPFLLMIAGRTPVIYDEFVNPVLVTNEHRLQKRGLVKFLMGFWNLLGWFYYLVLKRCAVILADTAAHGKHAAALGHIDRARYVALPVGTDEAIFTVAEPSVRPDKPFRVFFYSTGIQPLHGTQYVLEAAVLLKDRPDIEFVISGKRGNMAGRVAAARKKGARIKHYDWIPFEQLPDYIRASGVCLGGPFGNTPQAQMVITTKAYQFLACAAPTIVGRSEATNMFTDKDNALVVPQADARALANAILWSTKHPKQLAGIALAGRRLYEQQFSQQAITEALAAVIAGVSRHRR